MKDILSKLVALIGDFFKHLFKGAEDSFNQLPKDQQDAILKGVKASQIIKTAYTKGADFVIKEVASVLNVNRGDAETIIMSVGYDLGITPKKVQDVLDTVSAKVDAGLTNNGWNGLFDGIAKFAALAVSTGSLNWVTLGFGVIEYALQYLKQTDKKNFNPTCPKGQIPDGKGGCKDDPIPPDPTHP